MNIYVHTDRINIPDRDTPNRGEYHSRDCIFIFDKDYQNLVKKALFTNEDGETYEMVITNNKCKIPSEVVEKEGSVTIGVYGYKVDDNDTLILRYSPKPSTITVTEGSYIEDIENPSTPTPSVLEQLEQAVAELDESLTNDYYDKDATDDLLGAKANVSDLADVATTGDYNDLSNKPTIPTIPANVSAFTNDAGYIDKNVNELTNYELKTNTGSSIGLSIDSSTYVVTLSLKNSAGTVIDTKTIDLPLESVVVNGSYDSTNKKVILTLQSGSTVEFSVADLISGLQSEISSQNKVVSDFIDDTNQSNKFVTSSDKSTWNAKYDKPSGGIPSTDMSSAVQASLNKADSAIQDVSGKEDKTNKVTSLSSSSTDTQYPSAKCIYDIVGNIANTLDTINGEVV